MQIKIIIVVGDIITHIMKNTFVIFVLITFSILTTDLKAENREIPNNESKIILHDGMFGDGLPNYFEIDDSKKNGIWGWGNWYNSSGEANLGFAQTSQGRILSEKGMLPKKVLKTWGVEDYKLGKKKGFKSSGSRALVQLVEINNKKCVVIISRFGPLREMIWVESDPQLMDIFVKTQVKSQ